MTETHLRSLIKGITWRLFGTLSTIVISFAVTRSFKMAGAIGLFEFISKLVLYYVHERVWGRIRFGKKPIAVTINKAS